jgi:hypothetical protein
MANDDREHTSSFQTDLAYKNMVVNFDTFGVTVNLVDVCDQFKGKERAVNRKPVQCSAVQGARRGQ